MILFSEVIEQLEAAEFSLQGFVDVNTGLFKRDKYNRLITLINTVMNDLHVKFTLRQGECTILTQEGKYNYEITRENSISRNPLGFIQDTVLEPFDDDIIELTGVKSHNDVQLAFNVNTMASYPYNLNEERNFSVYNAKAVFKSPKQGVLRIPVGLEPSVIKLTYKVGPEKIERIPKEQLTNFDTDTLVIPMADIFLMPIVFYCCSRMGNARGNERAGQSVYSEGSSYYSKYLSECSNIQSNLALANETHEPVNNFRRQGFV